MARIRGYIAASLDGYIADTVGGLDWLSPYEAMELGEHDFEHLLGSVATVVMGRDTYDFVARGSADWPYTNKRVIVVTSRPLPDPVGELSLCNDIEELIRDLRALTDGDVWIVGGGQLQSAFIERRALDEIELFVIPDLIGRGVPLFPASRFRASLELIEAKPLDRGCAYLRYSFKHRQFASPE